MKIWMKTKGFSEGKYLVVRRDGTIPAWPWFVLGGDDPCVPNALRAYADEAQARGHDPEYVASIRELADDYESRPVGKSDPDAPPHRVDNPAIVALMRRHGDLADLGLGRAIDEVESTPLETRCDQCEGRGGENELGRWGDCPWCDGAGYKPTAVGKRILDFLGHYFEIMMREAADRANNKLP